jgi:O-antigen/teichoic acid export membrane protein
MIVRRLANSTVVWSWVLNGLRLASGLIILPLVFRLLTKEDVGMYSVLVNLALFATMLDFGFGPTIGRFIGYAMGGAVTLEAQGVSRAEKTSGPNYVLLWELLVTTRRLYRYLTLALFLILGTGGTFLVGRVVHQTSSPLITWLAWVTTLVSTLFDIYSNWWVNYLRGLNEVKKATQIGVLATVIKLVVAAGLLLGGLGLLSLPTAVLASGFIQRYFARVWCLKCLPPRPPMHDLDLKKMLAVLWPNSWRTGIQLLSGTLTTQANTFICADAFDLVATAKYGPSIQLMGIATGMAYVWISIKWPLISQYQARHEFVQIQRVLWPRFWLQTLTFLVLAAGVIFVAPGFLHWIGKDKELLPQVWLTVLAVGFFLDLQFACWGTLITTTNRLPFLWPSVATNVLSLLLTLALVHFSRLGIGSLVLGPLLAGSLFNYWYWPPYAVRGMGTTFLRFLFSGPTPKAEG